jgi:hypothetical protein
LGTKYLVVLCAGSTLLLVQSKALDEAPYKLSGAIAKLAYITFRRLAFSWIRLNLDFLLRENLLLYSSYLPLGVPNWTVKLHQHRAASTSRMKSGRRSNAKSYQISQESGWSYKVQGH